MRLNNPNVLTRKGCSESPIMFKETMGLVCIVCDTEFPLNTTERFYLLNRHGWGFCKECIKPH